ncbi:hypothetical protein DINM_022474 [Dirofilaria immitis]|nr:hypothetical protein [Dirofilaria immitis]
MHLREIHEIHGISVDHEQKLTRKTGLKLLGIEWDNSKNEFNDIKATNDIRKDKITSKTRKQEPIRQYSWLEFLAVANGIKALKFIKQEIDMEKQNESEHWGLKKIGEYVMNLKSDDLWQILVVPQVVIALIRLHESGANDDYLSQFRISWKVVNHHSFDRNIYQDDFLLNSLENAFKCKLIVNDDENEEDLRQ